MEIHKSLKNGAATFRALAAIPDPSIPPERGQDYVDSCCAKLARAMYRADFFSPWKNFQPPETTPATETKLWARVWQMAVGSMVVGGEQLSVIDRALSTDWRDRALECADVADKLACGAMRGTVVFLDGLSPNGN